MGITIVKLFSQKPVYAHLADITDSEKGIITLTY